MSEKDEPDRCGIKGIYTGENDPFKDACTWHDHAYMMRSWHELNAPRRYIDKQFLIQMQNIAGDSTWLKAKAYLYYGIARLFGSSFWEGLSDANQKKEGE